MNLAPRVRSGDCPERMLDGEPLPAPGHEPLEGRSDPRLESAPPQSCTRFLTCAGAKKKAGFGPASAAPREGASW